jgi:hypothetical protein
MRQFKENDNRERERGLIVKSVDENDNGVFLFHFQFLFARKVNKSLLLNQQMLNPLNVSVVF